jgi:cellulose synthase (UDP-forming)
LQGLLRVHYVIMPACISTSMLAMLIYPFDFRHVSSWVYVTLPPYLYLVCRDLVHTGYRRTEFFKAYTLFMVLLPVVLTGVLNSVLQIVFGDKANFGRTPKVAQRTAAPAFIHISIWGLFVWSILTGYDDLTSDKELHALFAGSNALALGYGIFVLIGIRESLQDILLAVRIGLSRLKQRLLARKMLETDPVPAGPQLVKAPSFSSVSAAPAEGVLTIDSLPAGKLVLVQRQQRVGPTARDAVQRHATDNRREAGI